MTRNVDEEHFMGNSLTRADYMHERRTDSSGKSIVTGDRLIQ